MRRIWIIAGLTVAVGALVATVALAETTPPVPGSGYGRRIQSAAPAQGRGPGMMGRGGFGMGPRCGMADGAFGPGAGSYDPTAMLTRHEAMIARQEARVAALQAQVDAAKDETAKARLATMLERMQVSLGAAKAKLPVFRALPADYLEGMIALAKSDVAYFSSASSTDAAIQAWIDQRLAVAQARLEYFEAEAAK